MFDQSTGMGLLTLTATQLYQQKAGSNIMLTQKYLKEILEYSPVTGIFRWKRHRNSNSKIGDIAGTMLSIGYRMITIDYARYYAHRLAWLYMTGSWPKGQIDHINWNGDDNKWSNLRQATNSQNIHNIQITKRNRTGFKGVYWFKNRKMWHVRTMLKNERVHIGYFDNIVDAAISYNYHVAHLHGDYAVLNKIPEPGYLHD